MLHQHKKTSVFRQDEDIIFADDGNTDDNDFNRLKRIKSVQIRPIGVIRVSILCFAEQRYAAQVSDTTMKSYGQMLVTKN